MKVLVVGGTGFIGHHIVRELLTHGHDVTVLVRTPPTNLPAAVAVQLGDLTDLSDERLNTIVAGHRGVIVASAAAVAAPRSVDIDVFFYDTNVAPVARLLAAGSRAQCDRAVILGSFYATLQREQPSLCLAELSPYIASRIEQAEHARAAVNAETSVAVLELPYVAGTTPGRQSPLEPMLHSMSVGNADILAYPGITAVVTATQVAQAAIAALDRRADGNYPVVTVTFPGPTSSPVSQPQPAALQNASGSSPQASSNLCSAGKAYVNAAKDSPSASTRRNGATCTPPP
ncbi:Nucleoside-diphosphate-sugar epimerase [Amycolatopsis lurida]|uniref:NAD-dependent epimerase/dehydratase family protein n=1 Tax=Amycolatopsis lurida TaxID=31959 RepID=UPI0008988356|nr:NAD(P)-dependent oxidoreductase [Amycolatopsis lurida]SEE20666.1 Nucleoside-diphosphate-sugar epimerase [Amycolatopsis lurida]